MSIPALQTQGATTPFPQPQTLTIDLELGTSESVSPPLSSSSSVVSASESENTSQDKSLDRRSRIERPRMSDRQRSTSIIIPKGGDMYQKEKPDYPPDDARAMSPRRSSHDLERMEKSARQSLKDKAQTLQSSLAALAERIDEVKSDHDKLESENKFLQDYIGGLTRTMSRDGIGSAAKKGKK